MEESAVSEDDLSPVSKLCKLLPQKHYGTVQEEEGICNSEQFSEEGMISLLEEAAELFGKVCTMLSCNLYNEKYGTSCPLI